MRSIRKMKLSTRYFPSFLLALIAIIIVFAPYQENTTLGPTWLHGTLLATNYVLLSLAIILLIINHKKGDFNRGSIIAAMPAILLFILNLFHSYLDIELGGLTTAAWVALCFSPNDVRLQTFKIFKIFWCLTCFFGIICFVSYLLYLPLPYQEVAYYYGGTDMNYIDYGIVFLYKYDYTFRLCGICNEPGLLGTFCALILCADAINLKKKSNIMIFIAGILSFSLAFFLIVLAYLVLKIVVVAHNDPNKRRKILRYNMVIAILIGYFMILPNIETGNTIIDRTIRRAAITSDGLAGDNRTNDEFDRLFNSSSTMDLIAGMGRGYVRASGITEVSSYKIYIVDYGLFASLILWGSLLFAALYGNTKNKAIVIFVIAFFASIYQRPNIFTLGYAIILFGGIEYIKYSAITLKKDEKWIQN